MIARSVDQNSDNQAGSPPERNLFTSDPLLVRLMGATDCAWALPKLDAFGALMGRHSTLELAEQANGFPPELHRYDASGHRIDQVRYHPAYHALMDIAIGNGLHSIAWTAGSGGHRLHTALEYLFAQIEGGACCPVTMTYAAYPLLNNSGDIAGEWARRLLATHYDSGYKPAGEKRGVTLGMAMTERQGGSDLRSNTTRARPINDDLYSLEGHKWFCSAPMSDAFLTLARCEEGLTCFLVPR